MRRRKHREQTRQLWDDRYKPYYEITFLDDIDPDRKLNEKEVIRRWWAFLDDIEVRVP